MQKSPLTPLLRRICGDVQSQDEFRPTPSPQPHEPGEFKSRFLIEGGGGYPYGGEPAHPPGTAVPGLSLLTTTPSSRPDPKEGDLTQLSAGVFSSWNRSSPRFFHNRSVGPAWLIV